MFFLSDIPQQSNADVQVFIRAYYWILACGLIELQHDSFYTQDTRFQTDLPGAYRQPTVVENINFQFDLKFYFLIENILLWEGGREAGMSL